MSKKKWRKEALESFETAKSYIIGKGGMSVVHKIVSEILEIEDFPSERETIHAIQEDKLVKGIFMAHAIAVTKVFECVTEMIKDGVLEPNGDRAAEMVAKIEAEEEDEEDEDEDDSDE